MATAIQDFLKSAPHGAAQVLQLLAAAESLTDDVACEIYEVAPIKDLSADLFVKALHSRISSLPEIANGVSYRMSGENFKLFETRTQTTLSQYIER